MRKKVAVALVALILFTAIFGGGFVAGKSSVPTIEPATIVISQEDLNKFTPLVESFGWIRATFYGELPTDEELIEAAIEGMIKFGLPTEFTYFYNPQKAIINRAMMKGRFGGIGVRLTSENGQTVVVSTNPGGPAEKAGIKPGDVITHVDGVSIVGESWDVRSTLVRGETGTEVVITVYRIGEGEIDLTITREVIDNPSVQTRILADGRVGYISLEIFGDTAADEVREALRQLINVDGVQGIILDIRGNPGGHQRAGLQVLSQFIPGGKAAAQVYSRDGGHVTLATFPGGIATQIPLVVLIDEGSASSSEMLAAAIKDYERGTLIGDTTLGKGVGQTPRTLTDGSLIMVVDHEFRSPTGRVVHEVGVQPDIRVPTSPYQRMRGEDRALERGIEVLLEEQKHHNH